MYRNKIYLSTKKRITLRKHSNIFINNVRYFCQKFSGNLDLNSVENDFFCQIKNTEEKRNSYAFWFFKSKCSPFEKFE